MYYSILHKYSHGWDDQCVRYTKSKALFDAICTEEHNLKYDDFSEKLKQDIQAAYLSFGIDEPIYTDDIDLCVALSEYLECTVVYPIVVLDSTELYASW